VETWLAVTGLTVFGVAAVALGAYAWRSASKIVTDARQTLVDQFGAAFPQLFTGEPDPRAARIAGAGILALGIAMLAVAAVVLVVSSR
jgi:hypothetical protein